MTGDVTGDVTGTATTITNTVQLQTARNIGGVSFNGTSDINLPGVNAMVIKTPLETQQPLHNWQSRTIAGVSFDGTSNISLNNNAITNGVGYITTSFTNTTNSPMVLGFISNVVEDTTPQLGGNLDLNSSDITGTGNINVTGNLSVNGVSTLSNVVVGGGQPNWLLLVTQELLVF